MPEVYEEPVIRLLNGQYFSLLNPDPAMIDLHCIALPLSRICRYGGQTHDHYSVAEHSVHCVALARLVGAERFEREIFMHDATEAFIGDMVRPLKQIVPGYEYIEERIARAIRDRFGLCDLLQCRGWIRAIDSSMLRAEKQHLYPEDTEEWSGMGSLDVSSIRLECWEPARAYGEFTEMANRLRIL